MKLYVEAMDATLVEFDEDGRVRFADEDWTVPSLQEFRAILHAARTRIEDLQDLIDTLERCAAARSWEKR
jgi:hypothetical protein